MTIRHRFNWATVALKDRYPSLAFGAGIGGMLGATFLACRATLKLEAVVDQTSLEIQKVEKARDLNPVVQYTTSDYRRDMARVYGRAAWRVTKLYGPAIIVGIGSITLLTKSHTTLRRRNRELALAYTALSQAYQSYKDRFKDEVNDDIRREMEDAHLNLMDAVEELGQSPRRPYGEGWSPYARFFDEYSSQWSPNPMQAQLTIKMAEIQANNKLRHDGVLYLNDVYDILGLDKEPGGQVVGWVYGYSQGDDAVDFDLYNPSNERFNKGWEQTCRLDFNVQGLVLQLLREKNGRKYG